MNTIDVKVSELLQEMQAYASERKIPIISPAGSELLARTVANCKPSSILEIGSAIGYSTLLMASQASLNTSIVSIEINSDRLSMARHYVERAGFSERVRFIEGDASEILPKLAGNFDFVFIDAAKGQYLDYLLKITGKLAPTATIVSDNVLFRGLVLSEAQPPRRYKTIVKRLRQYLQFITDNPQFSTTIHEEGDGLAISYYQRSESY